jgi:hypothetical protein
MQSWAAQELRYAQLGDARLNRRLVRLVEDLAAQPTASVPRACGHWAATKAAYRFWGSARVKPEAIQAAHRQSTVERVRGHGTILVIQDTTDLNFTHHPATRGLGPLDHSSQLGLKVHSALAVSAQGVPLGLIHQEVWTRDPAAVGKRHQRRRRETKEKESQRWLTALTASQEAVPEGIEVITIADREADIYDLFAMPRRPGVHLLIRATHNRRVSHEARYLWPAIRQSPARGPWTIEVQRKDDHPPRQATLTVRYETLAIHPPRHHRRRASLPPISVQVILAEEENPPPGVKPISWLLLTTWPVTTFEEALQCVRWYRDRWLVERYHFVLKSGCRVEELQLEESARIRRALATYCIVAWRLLWLTYEARQNPDSPCDRALETHEWQALYCTIHKTPIPPATPPTLHEAVRWVAQLGGFLGRKHDGEPGVKSIWRGLRRLEDIAATWKLLHSNPPAIVDT